MNKEDQILSILVEMQGSIITIKTKLEEHDRRFEKIEAKLEEHDQRFEKLETKLEEHDRRFEKLETKLEEHDRRFEKLETKLEQHDRRFEKLETKLEEHDQRFEKLETKLEEHDQRFEKSEQRFNLLENEIKNIFEFMQENSIKVNNKLDLITARLDIYEENQELIRQRTEELDLEIRRINKRIKSA